MTTDTWGLFIRLEAIKTPVRCFTSRARISNDLDFRYDDAFVFPYVARDAVEFHDHASGHPHPTLAVESVLRFPSQHPLQRPPWQKNCRFQNAEVGSWDPPNIGPPPNLPDKGSPVVEPRLKEVLLLEPARGYGVVDDRRRLVADSFASRHQATPKLR